MSFVSVGRFCSLRYICSSTSSTSADSAPNEWMIDFARQTLILLHTIYVFSIFCVLFACCCHCIYLHNCGFHAIHGYFYYCICRVTFIRFACKKMFVSHNFIDRRLGGVSSPLGRSPRTGKSCRVVRACARSVCLVGSQLKFRVSGRSLFPFGAPAFPFSLLS